VHALDRVKFWQSKRRRYLYTHLHSDLRASVTHTDRACIRYSSVNTRQYAHHSIVPPSTTHTMQALRGAAQPACLPQRSVAIQPFKATPLRATRLVQDSDAQVKAADLCHLMHLRCVSPNLL
jgi:hypothetical protein